jgi:WD40 repeat protein
MGEGYVRSVAYSPDGSTLAAGYAGGVVLWDVATRRRRATELLPVKEGYVESVAFSPDGNTLAAGYSVLSGRDVVVVAGGGVVLWDVAVRRRRAAEPFPVAEGGVEAVAFSPDGNTLAAGYGGRVIAGQGGVVLWDVDLESWRRIAGRIANRNFTRDEWRQYFPVEVYRRTFPELPDGAGATDARVPSK